MVLFPTDVCLPTPTSHQPLSKFFQRGCGQLLTVSKWTSHRGFCEGESQGTVGAALSNFINGYSHFLSPYCVQCNC